MIDEKTLYDKIYACSLGKNIGGTLGAPTEGRKELLDISWYPRLPQGAAIPNDDLDLQLLNLHAAEQYGPGLTSADIAAEWCEHVFFPWDEYGAALTAMRYGFVPPYSGGFDNHFTDCMGSPIRSEIWAAICAGNPAAAAYYAWQDAVVDHAGGEGVWGEIFNAVLEAMAFLTTDRERLIEDALTYIPEHSRVYRAVAYALGLFRDGADYRTARELTLKHHGRYNFTDAPQNIAFQTIGLLWGDDFEDVLLKTVNLGYDTDCTVATLGAILGIMYGRAFIPEKWSAPIGDAICVSPQVRGFPAPANLDELTRRTITLRRVFMADGGRYEILPGSLSDMLSQRFTLPAGCREGVEFRLCYDSGPAISSDFPCRVSVNIVNNTFVPWKMYIKTVTPPGFIANDPGEIIVAAGGCGSFDCTVKALGEYERINRFAFAITRINDNAPWFKYRIPFTILGANRWVLGGRAVYVPGSTVSFEDGSTDGIYIAEGVLYAPADRDTQVICATECPVVVTIDGKTCINSPDSQPFLPAYHRAPAPQRTTLRLAEGRHEVRVELRSSEPPRFVFALTAPRQVSEPGNYYAYIDDWMV